MAPSWTVPSVARCSGSDSEKAKGALNRLRRYESPARRRIFFLRVVWHFGQDDVVATRGWLAVHLTFMVKVVSMTALLLFLAGCSPNNTESLQRHTADATAAAKRDAGAIARGVAEGLARKGPLDINAASATQLQTLPGVTPELAGKIVDHRPYTSTRDLVRRRILSGAEFDRLKGQIVVK
jgi:DNA uptake protein ComE-like DNA-binding protein